MSAALEMKNATRHMDNPVQITRIAQFLSANNWTIGITKSAMVLCGLALAFVSPAQATTVTLTTADGLGADTFLNGGPQVLAGSGLPRRDTNFGDLNRLVVKFFPSGAMNNDTDFDANITRISLLRFDLSSITGTITAASLTLGVRITENNQNGVPADVSVSLARLQDGVALDGAPSGSGWTEDGITMNNSVLAPGNAFPIQNLGTGANRVFAGDPTTVFSGGSVLDSILLDTNNLVTFVILPNLNSPEGIQFFSKENLAGGLFPTLELTVTGVQVVPLPSSLGLFGLGLTGLYLLQRRRRLSGQPPGRQPQEREEADHISHRGDKNA